MGITGIHDDDYMHVTENTLRHGDPPHFLWGKHLQCMYIVYLILDCLYTFSNIRIPKFLLFPISKLIKPTQQEKSGTGAMGT